MYAGGRFRSLAGPAEPATIDRVVLPPPPLYTSSNQQAGCSARSTGNAASLLSAHHWIVVGGGDGVVIGLVKLARAQSHFAHRLVLVSLGWLAGFLS